MASWWFPEHASNLLLWGCYAGHQQPAPTGCAVGVCLSRCLSSCAVLHPATDNGTEPRTSGGVILSALADIFPQRPHPARALTLAIYIFNSHHVASTCIFIACMQTLVPWIFILISLQRLWVFLLTNTSSLVHPVMSLESQCQLPHRGFGSVSQQTPECPYTPLLMTSFYSVQMSFVVSFISSWPALIGLSFLLDQPLSWPQLILDLAADIPSSGPFLEYSSPTV